MAATIFDFVAGELEARSDLVVLEARGTVRLALKAAGLTPQSVTREQMGVVLQKVLPGELVSRGVSDARALCGALAAALQQAELASSEGAATAPEEVFRRLAGS